MPRIDIGKIIEEAEAEGDDLDTLGVCVACGEVCYDGVEPDAEGYECQECGRYAVIGLAHAALTL